MKRNDLTQIKALDIKELKLKTKSLSQEIIDLLMDKNMKKTKDLKTSFKKRKELAQVLTILNQKLLLADLEAKNPKEIKKWKEE